MIKNYKIFGKIVQIVLSNDDNKVQKEILIKYFSLYEEIYDIENPDFVINIHKEEIDSNIVSINPKIHIEIENGFKSLYRKISITFSKNKTIYADVSLEIQKKGFVTYLKKLNNIEYKSIDERISQILYELVLVPSVYFDSDKILVHSSAFKNKNNKAVLIGGTGGVGKTSLEIELCMNRNHSFIADDISVVDLESNVYPNLSFPKIYSYNLENNKKLENYLFKDSGILDKFAWEFKKTLFGPAGVRRSISPLEAYGQYQKNKIKLDKYYILFKKDVKKISIEKIDEKQASEMTLSIIQSEYSDFNKHILWHEFNCKANNTEPILNLEIVLSRWKENAEKIFKTIDCYIINIPFKIEHNVFVKTVADLID